MVWGWWLRCSKTILINSILHTKISPFPCMQGGTCGTENCYGRGLMYSAWPIRVGWVAGSGWMPIWLTNADQLRSAHAEPGSQSNQPQSVCVTCGSSVKSVFWIWPLRPGCSTVSWDLWKGTIGIDKEELKELIQFLFLIVNSFWFFAMFLAESLNQFDLKPFWIQLTRISLDRYIILYDNLSIKWILHCSYWLHL